MKNIPRLRTPYLISILLAGIVIILFVLLVQTQRDVRSAEEVIQNLHGQIQTADDCEVRDTFLPDTTTRFSVTTKDAGERGFLVHTPSTFSPQVKYPVIIGLTGKGASAPGFQQAFGLDTLPALTVYPEATNGIDGVSAWQGAPYSSGVNDVAFIDQMLDSIEGTFCVKRPQVYTVGMSNGGGMAWILSCQLSDRIAAFAMVAGAYYNPDQSCEPSRPAAVLSIHGDQDLSVPYNGSTMRDLPSIPYLASEKAKMNGCEKTPTVVVLPYSTETTTWDQCIEDATVKNIRLLGLGHVWPSAITSPLTPSAATADLLWDFFSRHPIK